MQKKGRNHTTVVFRSLLVHTSHLRCTEQQPWKQLNHLVFLTMYSTDVLSLGLNLPIELFQLFLHYLLHLSLDLTEHNLTYAFFPLDIYTVSTAGSLLILTSENGNVKDKFHCFAQVWLNSYSHRSSWDAQLTKLHIPEANLSISMASCNAILCRMAHDTTEAIVSSFCLRCT